MDITQAIFLTQAADVAAKVEKSGLAQAAEIGVIILTALGSLCLFLFGMKVMSDGLQKTAGEKLQKTLNWMTYNRFLAVLTGTLVTVLVQSSSATTVMIVSFANAGLLTLTQSIGVIMGANIGTTVTAWLVTLANVDTGININAIAIPVMAMALPLFFSKKDKFKNLGEVIIGFAIIFIGLEALKSALPNIKENEALQVWLANFFESMTNDAGHFKWAGIIATVLIGMILTAVFQSSSAITAIAITLVSQGFITFEPAAALVIGSNIGTTITAYLAALGTNTTAKRASMAHILFNVFGALWCLAAFRGITLLINNMLEGPTSGMDPKMTATIMVSAFHTLFNVTNTVLLVGFIKWFAKLVEKIIPVKEGEISGVYKLRYIKANLQDTPEINIKHAKVEIHKMGDIVETMFNQFKEVLNNPDKKLGDLIDTIKKEEEYTDDMQVEINSYLAECSKENLNAQSRENINAMIRIVNEFESIADCCFNLIILTQKKYEGKVDFDAEAYDDLEPYIETVNKFINFINQHLNEHLSKSEFIEAQSIENQIDEMRNNLRIKCRERLQYKNNIVGELLYLDMVKQIEKIGDYALNIAQALRKIK
ncbi:MAG: Na/Pi cotransporter family protein [Spirochaetales bacterium]|nr:Na/Pi cotransporter family protein [Spirochaetales bacterium]